MHQRRGGFPQTVQEATSQPASTLRTFRSRASRGVGTLGPNMATYRSTNTSGFVRNLRLLFLACSVALPIAACGDDAPAPPGPIPLDSIRDELSKATCEQYVRCGNTPDAATCTATQGDLGDTLQLLTDAVLGRVTYDPAAARTCVEAIRAYTCGTTVAANSAVSSACAGMFVGTVPEAGPCLLSEECAGDSYCDLTMAMGGGACNLGVCAKKPSLVSLGGDCTMNPCVVTAYCDQSAMPFTCKERKANGEACDAVDGCNDGLRCDVGGNPQTCYGLRNRGDICNPALKQGACLRFDDYCEETERKCKQLPGDGMPCAPNDQCLKYAFCDNGTCKKRAVEGEACVDKKDCLGTLSCQDMLCKKSVSDEVCAF